MKCLSHVVSLVFSLFVACCCFAADVDFGPERLISGTTDGAVEAIAADLDGDGDLDVVSVSDLDDKVAWYENNGLGSFGPERIISSATDKPYALASADLDSDGDIDLIIGFYGGDKVTWYENTGTGFSGHDMPGSLRNSVGLDVGDIDQDGDLDVVAVELYPGKLAWYRNEGGSFSQESIATGLNYPYNVRLADIDGDADLDVVAPISSDHQVVWFENTGGGGFNGVANVMCPIYKPRPIDVVDVDGDGDIDLIAASAGADLIIWCDNLGAGVFAGASELISNTVDAPYGVSAVDIDDDGDPDVLSAGTLDYVVAWHENLGGGGFDLTRNVISTTVTGAYGVRAADLDGDGDLDVLATAYHDDKVCWYENLGSPPPQAILNLISLVESFDLPPPVERSLIAPLHQAVEILLDDNPNNDGAVCGKLGAFLNSVKAKEKAGKLTSDQADALRQRAESIRNDLGCDQ